MNAFKPAPQHSSREELPAVRSKIARTLVADYRVSTAEVALRASIPTLGCRRYRVGVCPSSQQRPHGATPGSLPDLSADIALPSFCRCHIAQRRPNVPLPTYGLPATNSDRRRSEFLASKFLTNSNTLKGCSKGLRCEAAREWLSAGVLFLYVERGHRTRNEAGEPFSTACHRQRRDCLQLLSSKVSLDIWS